PKTEITAPTSSAPEPAQQDRSSETAEIILKDYAPLHEGGEDCADQQERFERSVANYMADLIAMQAYWTREFGKWADMKLPSHVLEWIGKANKKRRSVAEVYAVDRLDPEAEQEADKPLT